MRVDASAQIGSGHVTRCIAFASALRRTGVHSTFLCAQLPTDTERSILDSHCDVIRLPLHILDGENPFALDQIKDSGAVLQSLGKAQRFDCMVVDHYGIDHVWQSKIRERVPLVMAIDDLADRVHDVDFVLNQSLQLPGDPYAGLVPNRCRRLLGPRFALMRPEFAVRRNRPAERSEGDARRVVLFAGGGDPDNATARVLNGWAGLEDLGVWLDVIIGSQHPHRLELEERCASMQGVSLHVQTDRMVDLLARADLLIGAAGTVSWERCCLGLPALMFAIADNQNSNLKLLAAHRTGLNLGRATDLDTASLYRLIRRVLAKPRLLRRMGRRAARLVDGLGAMRAALVLGLDSIALRKAEPSDASLTWSWRNEPSTRRFFRDARALTLAEHTGWWGRATVDAQRRLFIAHCADQCVGVLRFDIQGNSAEVSIYVDPLFTGLGLGPSILRAGQAWARINTAGLVRLEAEILPGNRASEGAFSAVGFKRRDSRWFWEVRK